MSSKVRSFQRAKEKQQAKDGQITTTLAQLIHSGLQTKVNSAPALLHLLGQSEIPIKQAFLIGQIARQVFLEIEQYQATYKTLCERYAEKDADGKARMIDANGKPLAEGQPGRYDILPEKMPEFQKEHQELVSVEVSFPGQKIKVAELGDVKIAPAHTMNLDWLLET